MAVKTRKLKNKKAKKTYKKKEDFFDRVYKVVAKIPYGKVTTYGDVAEACGIRSAARTVGWALHDAKSSGLPCHRVVNRFGALSGKMHFGDPHLMGIFCVRKGLNLTRTGA